MAHTKKTNKKNKKQKPLCTVAWRLNTSTVWLPWFSTCTHRTLRGCVSITVFGQITASSLKFRQMWRTKSLTVVQSHLAGRKSRKTPFWEIYEKHIWSEVNWSRVPDTSEASMRRKRLHDTFAIDLEIDWSKKNKTSEREKPFSNNWEVFFRNVAVCIRSYCNWAI